MIKHRDTNQKRSKFLASVMRQVFLIRKSPPSNYGCSCESGRTLKQFRVALDNRRVFRFNFSLGLAGFTESKCTVYNRQSKDSFFSGCLTLLIRWSWPACTDRATLSAIVSFERSLPISAANLFGK